MNLDRWALRLRPILELTERTRIANLVRGIDRDVRRLREKVKKNGLEAEESRWVGFWDTWEKLAAPFYPPETGDFNSIQMLMEIDEIIELSNAILADEREPGRSLNHEVVFLDLTIFNATAHMLVAFVYEDGTE